METGKQKLNGMNMQRAADVDSLVEDVLRELEGSSLSVQLKRIAQSECINSNLKRKEDVVKCPQIEYRLRNFIFNYLQRERQEVDGSNESGETPGFMEAAQASWEKRIVKSISSMSAELGVALVRRRSEKEQREMLARWSELGANEPDLGRFRPVYAAKDFQEVVASLRNPNLSESYSDQFLGLVHLPLGAESLEQLRMRYKELHMKQPQAGVDDQLGFPPELFLNNRIQLANAVLGSKMCHLAQEFCKQGCPMGYRSSLWKQALNVKIDEEENMEYEGLKQQVIQQDLLTDALIYKDVKMTSTNDDQYFVFGDYLYQILLPFSRDNFVLNCFERSCKNPVGTYPKENLGSEGQRVNYPPNGVVPFHGFSMYAAPLCYVYNDPIDLYFVFRELYVRHFHKLHALSSCEDGIVSLCFQFEYLLQHYETNLFLHLRAIGMQPLKVSFKWMIRGFSGFLASEQVLHLWDRMIGYNSLIILSITAAAIFSFRKVNLMQVKTNHAAEAIMADLLTLEVMPLIQMFLFAGK